MVEVRDWTAADGAIDHTFGYNDAVLTYRTAGDGQRAVDVADPANPLTDERISRFVGTSGTASETDVQDQLSFQPGDVLLRYRFQYQGGERTALILRRSIFTDTCQQVPDEHNRRTLTMTPAAATAISYFSEPRDDIDSHWCSVPHTTTIPGNPEIVTPWDLTRLENMAAFQRTLESIRAARTSSNPEERRIATAVEITELDSLQAEIERRRVDGQNAVERWMSQSTFAKIADISLAAVVFTVVGGILHLLWNGWGGGNGPHGGGGGGGGGIRGLLSRLATRNTTTTAQAPAPETATGERAAFEMNATAYWVGAIGAATLIAGLFHMRGRARETEVREGEVRVRENAEFRVRELAAQAPAARPRVEVRGAQAPGGMNVFELLGARPAMAH